MEKLYEIYTGCGYRVVLSSTYEGEGMDEIHEILKGKTTVVAGPSGVGNLPLPTVCRVKCRWRLVRSAKN